MNSQNTLGIASTVSRWLLGLILTLGTLTSVRASGEGWLMNFDEAKKQAAAENKDLLLDFTGSDWCPPCMLFDKEVLSQKSFLTATRDKFVLVEVDFPQNKKLDPKITEQNDALQEKYKIEGYPTIILCDASGKPYVQTGYQPGGPDKYAAHLEEFHAIRVKRDAAFAKAENAKDNAEKAAALVEGLQMIDFDLVTAHYSDVIEQINQLDPEDKTGFVKIRKTAIEKKEAAARAEAALEGFVGSTVIPMIEGKEFDKALTATKTFIKENPELSEESRESILLGVGLAGPLEEGDLKAAHTVIDQLAKEYPDSGIAEDVDDLKSSVAGEIKQMENVQEESE